VLENLGPGARLAGMRVPEVIGKQQNDRRTSLFLSFIPGQSASDLLGSAPGLFPSIMSGTVAWLERWHHATFKTGPLQMQKFEQDILAPLERFADSLHNMDQYRTQLIIHGRTIAGNPVPFVDTHNDLTMANILLDERGQLGLVDWETGCPDHWPFVDFYYAVTDAVRIVSNCSDWLEAFKACYLPEGSYFEQVSAWRKRLQDAVHCPPGFAELCFHACWLHHASNESQVSNAEDPRPFFKVAQWLALHETIFTFK
jgi:hypothetical protein